MTLKVSFKYAILLVCLLVDMFFLGAELQAQQIAQLLSPGKPISLDVSLSSNAEIKHCAHQSLVSIINPTALGGVMTAYDFTQQLILVGPSRPERITKSKSQ